MCGIAGIIQQDGRYTAAEVEKMADAIRHRGPDGSGFWQNESSTVLLAQRRLAIIDLSDAARQPFHFTDRYVALHNGEIYNYIELREELMKRGYSFATRSDTEVLVAAYDCWNSDCVHHFDGMFAFAIWDRQTNELFAARDRFGEKPFYYSFNRDAGSFLFASEIKAFWPLNKGRTLNRRMLFNFLTIGYTDNPEQPGETFYEEVEKLPAACWLRLSAGGQKVTVHRYWSLDPEKTVNISDAAACEQFRALFQNAVRNRLRSDVEWGCTLSGGLDSSSVTTVAATQSEIKTKTFSIFFPGFEKNERPFVDKVKEQVPIDSFTTELHDADVASTFEKVIRHQDEPFTSSSLLAQYAVFGLAARQGVKVLLDGQGADEILGGYHKYYKWYWQELFRKRQLMKSKEIASARGLGVTEQFGIRNIIAALFPDIASVVLEKQYLVRALKQQDLDREFVRLQSREAYYSTPEIFSLNGALYFNTFVHGLEELLRYADRNSMAHGRELRLPFLSAALVEFIFSLPGNFKIRRGWNKWILREAMQPLLPSAIAWRKDKIGLEPPQASWMQTPDMKEMAHEARRKLVAEKILQPAVLGKSLAPAAAYEKNTADWKYLVAAQYV